MTTFHPAGDDTSTTAESCALDRECPPEAGCCRPAPAPGSSTRRAGFLAAGAGLACVAGCLAMALGAGGLAAAGGLLAGEAWIALAAGVAVAAIATVVLVRRKGGRIC
jgi:hypothetical protein